MSKAKDSGSAAVLAAEPVAASTALSASRGRDAGHSDLIRLVELDGLRGLAITSVLILHFISSSLGPLRRFVGIGWVGVDLFFVLSGFLITRILCASLGSQNFFRNFYARRALRIWPLYYAIVAFAFVGSLLLPKSMHVGAATLPYYLTFTQNLGWAGGPLPWALGVTWSLAIEEQFYLVWPLCVRFLPRRTLVRLLLGTLVLSPLLRGVALSRGVSPWTVYSTTWFRLDTIGAGALVALLSQTPLWARLEHLAKPVAAIALTTAAALCSTLLDGDLVLRRTRPINGLVAIALSVTFSILALGFGALIVSVTSGSPSWLQRTLRGRTLRYLGKVSFGLYLVHGVIIPMSQTWWRPWMGSKLGVSGKPLTLLVVGASVSATVVLAVASWRYFESPILRLRRLFPPRSPGDCSLVP